MGCSSLFSLLLVLCCAVYGSATRGVIVSTAVNGPDFACLLNEYELASIRGYQSDGQVDGNAVTNIGNARGAGFSDVDVYMVPCLDCGNPSGQVKNMATTLSNSNYDRIWLVVEGSWPGSQQERRTFLQDLLTEAETHKTTGVYTSEDEWDSIMGSGYSAGNSVPLWYANLDNTQSFNDFVSFGGWTQPTRKQYAGTTHVCNVDVKKSFYQ